MNGPHYIIELMTLTDDPPQSWIALVHDDNDPSLHLDISGESIEAVLQLVAKQLAERMGRAIG